MWYNARPVITWDVADSIYSENNELNVNVFSQMGEGGWVEFNAPLDTIQVISEAEKQHINE